MPSSPPLATDDISRSLATKSLGHRLHLHNQIPSTNTVALSLAQAGAAHGTVVIAEGQTAGRGRHGRPWFSPTGENLYCSVLLRGIGQSSLPIERQTWVPLVSALAVSQTVKNMIDAPLFLKWPNDLLLYERKVGGILCESSQSTTGDRIVVIGIGLNVNTPRQSFPAVLKPIAASLIEHTSHTIDRNQLLANLLIELERQLDRLYSFDLAQIRQAYIDRCTTLGRSVHVMLGTGHELIGTAESIAQDGALQVRTSTHAAPSNTPLIEVRAADVIHLTG